jgi:hypothetical protein
MEYFDNFIISSAALMEPVIAEFTAVIFGVGQWPGLWGWLGNVLVASGTFVVLYNDRNDKTAIKLYRGDFFMCGSFSISVVDDLESFAVEQQCKVGSVWQGMTS